MVKGGTVYILANKTNSVLYTDVTSNLSKRVLEHKTNKYPDSFSTKYNCSKLVFYKNFLHHIDESIAFEKKIKKGSRNKKIDLINEINYEWKDLWDLVQEW